MNLYIFQRARRRIKTKNRRGIILIMKLVGFAQLRNELSAGNLIYWLDQMLEYCNHIMIYDQASNDGSLDIYDSELYKDRLTVIRSTTNNFDNELLCKDILLQKLLLEHPDTDWIFWMDGDTALDRRLTPSALENWLREGDIQGVDGYSLGHYNLWRSDSLYRLDSDYHNFHKWGRIPFWRNNGKLEFPKKSGLHHSQEPIGLDNVIRLDYALVHYGFASDSAILSRYETYKSRGQSGQMLSRLIDESKLWLLPIPKEVVNYSLNLNLPSKTIKRIINERHKNA